jgi:16S rRNA A1518/A1519 N6-dimethyltransferase RsmA/KsgA/DIM1 with predicted DNA glycosylase/AP lyase activity
MAIEEDPEGNEAAAFASAGVCFTSRRVLEVGCGDGRLTKRYADVAASVVAIDPDRDAVAQLLDELPTVDARSITFDELVLPEHGVDVVFFAWSL